VFDQNGKAAAYMLQFFAEMDDPRTYLKGGALMEKNDFDIKWD